MPEQNNVTLLPRPFSAKTVWPRETSVDPSDDFLSFPSVHLHSEPLTATERQYPIRENRRPPQRFRT